MKEIGVWQKYFSYLWPIRIESISSDYNPDLYIEIVRGRYQLCTDDAVYSHEDLYDNFGEILKNKLDLSDKGRDVLVLGLGLASVPIILDQIYPGQWDITAVEIDEEICILANEYAYPKIKSDINTVVTDAAQFVEIDSGQYDIICVDLFVGDKTPQKFQTKKFMSSLKDLLSDNGIIVYNCLAYTKEDKTHSELFYEEVFKPSFEDASMVYAHRNYMLLSRSDWFRK